MYLPKGSVPAQGECTCPRRCTCPWGVPAQGRCTCPRGCVPTQGMYQLWGCTCPDGGCTCPEGDIPACGVYLPVGCTCPGEVYLPQGLPPPCEQNDRCKNITLPQTSFVGGNNRFLNETEASGKSWIRH